MIVTEKRVRKVYTGLRKAQAEMHLAGKELARVKLGWERNLSMAISTGMITGKNKDEREQAAEEKFHDAWEEKIDTVKRERRAKFLLLQAQSHVNEVRLLTRLDELKAGIRPGEGH